MIPFLDRGSPLGVGLDNRSYDDVTLGRSRSQYTSDCNDQGEEGVYRTRFDESKAIVKAERGLRIDHRQRHHCDQMKKLYEEKKPEEPAQNCEKIGMPLSLDQYFHQDLADGEIQDRISSQVVSRFIFSQWRLREEPEKQEISFSTIFDKGGRSTRPRRNEYCDLETGPAYRAERTSDEVKAKIDSRFRQQILVVPQLWLLKVDSKFVPIKFQLS